MNIHDFRRIALSLEGAEESSHMGSPDFRVGGRIFGTLAAAKQGYGNIMITPEQQAAFVEELPEVFIPIKVAGAAAAQHTCASISLMKIYSPAHCAPPGSFASKKTPKPTKKAFRGQNLSPRRALHPKSASSVWTLRCCRRRSAAPRMPALAGNIRSLLHRFTLHAAIFPRRHRTRTNRMRALLALFGCHNVSFQRLSETSLIDRSPAFPAIR
jgi:hypothetical protein